VVHAESVEGRVKVVPESAAPTEDVVPGLYVVVVSDDREPVALHVPQAARSRAWDRQADIERWEILVDDEGQAASELSVTRLPDGLVLSFRPEIRPSEPVAVMVPSGDPAMVIVVENAVAARIPAYSGWDSAHEVSNFVRTARSSLRMQFATGGGGGIILPGPHGQIAAKECLTCGWLNRPPYYSTCQNPKPPRHRLRTH